MESEEAHPIATLLERASAGDAQAYSELFVLLYEDLRARARRELGPAAAHHTIQPTALVHEAYYKLVQLRDKNWRNRSHFMAVASRAMRSILVDAYRARIAGKRPPREARVPLDHLLESYVSQVRDLDALDEALERLAAKDQRAATILDMSFFGGFTMKEIAESLEVSERTVYRDLDAAKAFLLRELQP